MSSSPFEHVQECNSLMSAEITKIMGVQPFWFRSPLTDGNTAQPLDPGTVSNIRRRGGYRPADAV